MGQITVLSGPERRRRWNDEQRLQILTEAFAPGACPTEVARRHEISTGQLYTWRSKLLVDAPPAPDDGHCPSFAEAVVINGGDSLLERCHRHRSTARPTHHHLSIIVAGAGSSGVEGAAVIPPGARVWIAMGHTDMRKGMQGLAIIVQQALRRDPFAGDLYVFRGRAGSLVKIVWHDGIGMSLYAKRLEKGRFIWPSATDGIVSLTASQLACLLEGIDWRNPQYSWRPKSAG